MGPGTGAFYDVSVSAIQPFGAAGGRTSLQPLSRAFSYDRPALTAIAPTNAPPTADARPTVITVLGRNFGTGPATAPATEDACPANRPAGCALGACASYYLFSQDVLTALLPAGTVPRPARCAAGFTRGFSAPAGAGGGGTVAWNNVRPHSLAQDPAGCALNAYLCDEYGALCGYLQVRTGGRGWGGLELVRDEGRLYGGGNGGRRVGGWTERGGEQRTRITLKAGNFF